jgi:UDP-N-acetylmuramoyl-L-alanyl-D-glutamate--2,6-diaminopimelate ligase
MKKIIPQKIKNIFHFSQAIAANFWFGFSASTRGDDSSMRGGPSGRIKVIGVTGTNGKTTTCQIIAKILEEAGYKIAMASTINFKMGEKEWVNATKFTTLSSFQVQKFIREAVNEGCDYLVLETSSHSLDQFRVLGIGYEVAVITNITREHLDYHETMEAYRKAKLKLFKKANVAIVNLDMENPEDFLKYGEKKYGYSTKISNFKFQISNKISNSKNQIKNVIAEDIKLDINKSEYEIQDMQYKIQLPGLFNIENALAATCVGLSQEIDPEVIKKALEKIKGVPGRLEHIPNNKEVEIIVDYAVTPDSLERLYRYLRDIKKEGARIISVFGACGDRDRGKRPIMGEVVDRYADFIILTNEDPYFEDPWQIINEVAKGIGNKKEEEPASTRGGDSSTRGGNFWKIMDRREAIKKALQISSPGDTVVITGKGAEEVMAVREKRIPWNDKKVILEELGKI